MEGEAVLEVSLNKEGAFIKKCFNRDFCKQLGLEENQRIDGLEAAYFLSIKKACIGGRSGWDEALDFLEKLSVPLHLFIVYYDLRRRGRKVQRGLRDSTLLADVPGRKKIEVLILREGEEVKPSSISNWSELAVSDSYTPVVAIVDKNGEVTYYESRIYSDLGGLGTL